jgi:hypothetical protein
MIKKKPIWKTLLLLAAAVLWICSIPAMATEDDNSLSSLGILTEGATVSPEFAYGTVEYNVTVPAGTESLQLDPVPTSEGAWIVDINGTELVDGKATVEIVVSAANGDQYSYFLYVTAEEDKAAEPEVVETEPQTEKQTETEPETEDPRYVKVDRNSLEEAENTISTLKSEISSYRTNVGILTKILYGMIAFCIVLLFFVINLLLKKKDLKAELAAYRGYGYPQENQGYENQAYAGQGYEQGYPNQGYPEQGYEYQDYQNQGYEAQSYPEQGYDEMSGYAPDEGAQSYSMYEEPAASRSQEQPKKQEKPKKTKKVKDDPTTVPKPERARKQTKPMPEYQQPAQPYEYQQPANGKKKENDVEVTMIDL